MAPDGRLKGNGTQVRETFRSSPQAEIGESLPDTGPMLGAEPIGAAGDPTAYADVGHLVPAAGSVPVPRDSGRRADRLHRPERRSRRLRRVFCPPAQAA
jgi:hypothetical protein